MGCVSIAIGPPMGRELTTMTGSSSGQLQPFESDNRNHSGNYRFYINLL